MNNEKGSTMSNQYQIVEPCIYVVDDKTVQHREAGAIVEIDDAVAKELGDAVKLIPQPVLDAEQDAPADPSTPSPVERPSRPPHRPHSAAAAASEKVSEKPE